MKAPARDYGWQGDEPDRLCKLCGQPVVLKHSSVWFRRFPTVETWHMRSCP